MAKTATLPFLLADAFSEALQGREPKWSDYVEFVWKDGQARVLIVLDGSTDTVEAPWAMPSFAGRIAVVSGQIVDPKFFSRDDQAAYSWSNGYETFSHRRDGGGESYYLGQYHPDGGCDGNPCVHCGMLWDPYPTDR